MSRLLQFQDEEIHRAYATRFLHVLTGTANILLRPSRPAGKLVTVLLEMVEETGRIGVSALDGMAKDTEKWRNLVATAKIKVEQ